MPIIDSILGRFKKKPDPDATPITEKMKRSDGLGEQPASDVKATIEGMKPSADATDEHLSGMKLPSVEPFVHAERGQDFGMLGATHQHIPPATGHLPPDSAASHMPQRPMGPPPMVHPVGGNLEHMQQQLDILTDKVDIIQQQVKMIWDTLKSWRTR